MLTKRVDALESDMTTVKGELRELRSDMRSGFAIVRVGIERLERRLETVDADLRAHTETLNADTRAHVDRLIAETRLHAETLSAENRRHAETLNADTRRHAEALNAETIRTMEALHVETHNKLDERFNQTLVLHEEVLARIKAIGER